MPSALERAAEYVHQHGDELDRLRAGALVGQVPAKQVAQRVAATQSEQGAWAGRQVPAGPEGCLEALAMLCDLRQLAGASVERAVNYLAQAQREDGSWQDVDSDSLILTGMLGGYLARSLRARPSILAAVDRYLCGRWSPEQVQGGRWPGIAAFSHWFSVYDSELSDPALQWCGRELERGFRIQQFGALDVARVLTLCDAGALPGSTLTADELVEHLLAEQQADGSWPTGVQSHAPVEASLQAMLALQRLGAPHR